MSPRTMIEIAPGSLSRTRSEAAQALSDAGVPPDAAEAVLRSTGRQRHINRIQMHVEGALQQALHDEGADGLDPAAAPPSILALAAGLLLLDSFGPVPRPWETAPRVRHRAFRGFGSLGGPTASAIIAAAHGALVVLTSRFGVATPQIVLAPEDGDIRVTINGGRHSASALYRMSPTEREDCQPCGWTLHVAKIGLDRSVGLTVQDPASFAIRFGQERTEEDRFAGRSPLDCLHAFEGTASAWGEVWTRANSQQRLETAMERYGKVISELPPEEAQALPPSVGTDPRRPTMARALEWVSELELGEAQREAIAADLALGQLAPAALEERFRVAIGHRLARTA